jgi:hypothetical protein
VRVTWAPVLVNVRAGASSAVDPILFNNVLRIVQFLTNQYTVSGTVVLNVRKSADRLWISTMEGLHASLRRIDDNDGCGSLAALSGPAPPSTHRLEEVGASVLAYRSGPSDISIFPKRKPLDRSIDRSDQRTDRTEPIRPFDDSSRHSGSCLSGAGAFGMMYRLNQNVSGVLGLADAPQQRPNDATSCHRIPTSNRATTSWPIASPGPASPDPAVPSTPPTPSLRLVVIKR